MSHSFLRTMQPNHGTALDEAGGDEALYATPEELGATYGCCGMTEGDIRAAMALISAHTCRPSLWPCEFDSGDLEIPVDRQQTRLPVTPVIEITSLVGRFGMGRRDMQSWNGLQAAMASYLLVVGGQVEYSPIPIEQCAWDAGTGILLVTPSWLLAPYTVVRARFIAGFPNIPSRVKLALIEILNTIKSKGTSDTTRFSIGKMTRTYGSDTFISRQAEALLAPFVCTSLY